MEEDGLGMTKKIFFKSEMGKKIKLLETLFIPENTDPSNLDPDPQPLLQTE